MRLKRVAVVLLRAVRYFGRDDGAALAGYMAYTALLALFPFLIFATALAGLLIGEEGKLPVIQFLFDSVPEHVAKTLEPVIEEVVRNRSGSVLSFSAAGAIWIASNGFEALRIGLERAYRTRALRPWWKNRFWAILFVLAGVIAFGVLSLFIVFGPVLGDLARDMLGIAPETIQLFTWLRLGLGALLLGVFLTAIHWFLPGKRPGVPILPGVIFTIAAWMSLASVFAIYFRFVPSYAVTYGTLGGVIASLLFFYVSSMIFLFGAEINSAAGAGEERDSAPRGDGKMADSAPIL